MKQEHEGGGHGAPAPAATGDVERDGSLRLFDRTLATARAVTQTAELGEALAPEELNRLNRYLAEIEGNAKLATANSWAMDHGHVVSSARKYHPKGKIKQGDGQTFDLVSFDVAMAPFQANQTVRGLHPSSEKPNADMRHIATCSPKRILDLIGLVRRLLATTQG